MSAPRRSTLKAFGELVRNRRVGGQLSQERLGELSGLDRTYISGIERGVRNPSLTALRSLAGGFEVSVAELVGGLEKTIAHHHG